MTHTDAEDDILDLLRRHDTPTVCNAIEVAQQKRGFDNFTKTMFRSSSPSARSIVGYARTASIAGARPPTMVPERVREIRLNYFRHMASGPRPSVAVIEDTDGPDRVGAWWGEVHAAVHKGLGIAGAITNGLMRDLDEMDPDFPVLAGAIGPSHAFVHVRTIGEPVHIFGLTVTDGDLIHADQHGAVKIPPDVIAGLPHALRSLREAEQLILGPARGPDFDIQKLEEAWAAFEKART